MDDIRSGPGHHTRRPVENRIVRYHVFLSDPDGNVVGRARANIEISDTVNPQRLADTKKMLEERIAGAFLTFEWVVSEDTHEDAKAVLHGETRLA